MLKFQESNKISISHPLSLLPSVSMGWGRGQCLRPGRATSSLPLALSTELLRLTELRVSSPEVGLAQSHSHTICHTSLPRHQCDYVCKHRSRPLGPEDPVVTITPPPSGQQSPLIDPATIRVNSDHEHHSWKGEDIVSFRRNQTQQDNSQETLGLRQSPPPCGDWRSREVRKIWPNSRTTVEDTRSWGQGLVAPDKQPLPLQCLLLCNESLSWLNSQ